MPALVRTTYQSDGGDIHPIRLTQESFLFAGAPPTGSVTIPIRVKVSKGKREYGISPRGVILARTAGLAPDTFVKTVFLPVLTPAAFASPAYAQGTFQAYKGFEDWQIVRRVPEDY